MKKTILIISLLFLNIALIQAQTAEEILTEYTKVTGGQENWDNITSMKVKGTAKLISQNMELPFTRTWVKSGKHITSLKINGMDYISTAYDGTIAWGSNSQMQPEEKDAFTSETIKQTLKNYPYPTHNWQEKGFSVKLMGKETINDVETYKIKLIREPLLADGKAIDNNTVYYIDTKRFVPILTEAKTTSGLNKGQIMKTYLSDYRNVNGYLYPFTAVMKYREETFQIMETESVEFNKKIDNAIFKIPPQKK